jgi:hypothetical protein
LVVDGLVVDGLVPEAFAPCTKSRTDLPAAIIGTPILATCSAKSGGAHILTSTPCARNWTANANIGSTSPRDPHVDNNTRILATPIPLGYWYG